MTDRWLITGSRRGRATWIDYAGMAAGVLAPLLLIVYVVFAGAYVQEQRSDPAVAAIEPTVQQAAHAQELTFLQISRIRSELKELPRHEELLGAQAIANALERLATDRSSATGLAELEKAVGALKEETRYSHIQGAMTELGDGNDIAAWWFIWMNLAVAVLLAVFAIAVLRRMPVGRPAIVLLAGAVLLTMVIGITACDRAESCAIDPFGAQTDEVHLLAAGLILTTMILLPATATHGIPPTNRRNRNMRKISGFAGALAFVGAGLLVMALVTTSRFGLFERLAWAGGYTWVFAAVVIMWIGRKGDAAVPFSADRLQENVVYGSRRFKKGLALVGTISNAAAFRAALAETLRCRLIRGETVRPRPPTVPVRDFAITLGFTKPGLERLGIEYQTPSVLGDRDAFSIGMHDRATILGDVGASDPSCWEGGWTDAEVVFWILAIDDTALERAKRRLDELFERPGAVSWSMTQRTAQLGGAIPTEPFGFADGISQPWIDRVHPSHDPSREGGGKLTATGWRQIALGEFILGELDETADKAPHPEPQALFHHGTFMVVRKLQQNVQAFTELVGNNGAGARLVGRKRDGRPLARSQPGDSGSQNRFGYGDDPEGRYCPMGAHIRRANPRDALGFEGVLANRRRIIRRGMPYRGPDECVGLLFVAFNARIADQFEFIQHEWLNTGTPFRLGNDPDAIAGGWAGERRVVMQGEEPIVAVLDKPLTTTKGGAYFFVPSMAALHLLTEG